MSLDKETRQRKTIWREVTMEVTDLKTAMCAGSLLMLMRNDDAMAWVEFEAAPKEEEFKRREEAKWAFDFLRPILTTQVAWPSY